MANVGNGFVGLFQSLIGNVSLLKEERFEDILSWDTKDPKELNTLIKKGMTNLQGIYYDKYIVPLMNSLPLVLSKSKGTAATLAGAVFNHRDESPVRSELNCLLALISNTYRSFLDPESPAADIPKPENVYPALATFQPRMYQDKIPPPSFVPFILPANEVNRLCGGTVSVVSMPSCYREHPIMLWGSIAHEVGGHDILHAYRGLLPELRAEVRNTVANWVNRDGRAYREDQTELELLWQHWAEETACNVYAVMNLGPSYGLGLAVYYASLGEATRRNGRPKGDGIPALRISVVPRGPDTVIPVHPPKVLDLWAVIGAIDALQIPRRTWYTKEVKQAVKACLDGNEQLIDLIKKKGDDPSPYQSDSVQVEGKLQMKCGVWGRIRPARFSLRAMEELAYRIGYHIATMRLKALNNHTIQDLETWDDEDEEQAMAIKELVSSTFPSKKENGNPFPKFFKGKTPLDLAIENSQGTGDDAQIMAGSLLALYESPNPNHYRLINLYVGKALRKEFMEDDIWGDRPWHPCADLE